MSPEIKNGVLDLRNPRALWSVFGRTVLSMSLCVLDQNAVIAEATRAPVSVVINTLPGGAPPTAPDQLPVQSVVQRNVAVRPESVLLQTIEEDLRRKPKKDRDPEAERIRHKTVRHFGRVGSRVDAANYVRPNKVPTSWYGNGPVSTKGDKKNRYTRGGRV